MKQNISVLFRVIAASIGGYWVSVAFSLGAVPFLILVGATHQKEAVMAATMLSYVVYFCIIIYCFCRKSVVVVYRDLIILSCAFLLPFVWSMQL